MKAWNDSGRKSMVKRGTCCVGWCGLEIDDLSMKNCGHRDLAWHRGILGAAKRAGAVRWKRFAGSPFHESI